MLVYYITIISLNVTCSRHDIAEKLLIFALNNNHSFFNRCEFTIIVLIVYNIYC